jgi:hypothetical protein
MGKPRGGGAGGGGGGRGGNGGGQQKSNEPDLHAAARAGDLQKVESICNSNPLAVNTRDRHSRTPYPTLLSLFVFFCFQFYLVLLRFKILILFQGLHLIGMDFCPNLEI